MDKNNIEDVNIEEHIGNCYLDYSMSVITGRALPDARDGLKPVQRRIIYSMKELGITSRTQYKKSGRIVGDTMGKYHPHSDCICPDTLIYTLDGNVRTIEEIYRSGIDEVDVIAYDTKLRKNVYAKAHSFRIGQYTTKTYKLILDNGDTIEVTDNHPFLKVNDDIEEWVKTNELLIGDKLKGMDIVGLDILDSNRVITDIVIITHSEPVPMYDFTVDLYENLLIQTSDNQLIVAHNSAIYGALVRMAQDFSMSEPLIDGQGNYGSIDGDNAAASRYTEARLTPIGEELLTDLEKNTVDYIPNYDDTLKEPTTLPTKIPNLFLNGASGIAVGMSCNIAPHNIVELLTAIKAYIKDPNISIEKLMHFLPGPDFPTGAIIYGKEGIYNAYTTGKGRIKLRAKYHLEELKNGREQIIIDELPYQVNKSKLIEHIVALVRDKKIDGISLVRDESNKEGIRIVIELKKSAYSDIIISNLFKQTPLEISFSINNLALVDGEPKLLTLKDYFNIYMKHRYSVIIRATIFDLNKAKDKLHLLQGRAIAVKNIKAVVALITKSKDDKEAIDGLMSKFKLTEVQARDILNTRLGRLTGMEIDKLYSDIKIVEDEIKYLESILSNGDTINNLIINDIDEMLDKYKNHTRRTTIEENYDEITITDLIPNEQVVVTLTYKGYIKRVPVSLYEKQNRGGKGKKCVILDDDDYITKMFTPNTHDTLLIVSDKGIMYTLKVYDIPEGTRTSKGRNIVNLIKLDRDEKIKTIINTTDFADDKTIVFFTKLGMVKRTKLSEYANVRSNGVIAIRLRDNDEIVNVSISANPKNSVFISTYNGMSIRFPLESITILSRNSIGVRGITLKEDDYVISGNILTPTDKELVIITERGIGKRTLVKGFRKQARGGVGIKTLNINDKVGHLSNVMPYCDNCDLVLLTSEGKIIRTGLKKIPVLSRVANGVKIVKLPKGAIVTDSELVENNIEG